MRCLAVVASVVTLSACSGSSTSVLLFKVHATRIDASGAASDLQLDLTLTGDGPTPYCNASYTAEPTPGDATNGDGTTGDASDGGVGDASDADATSVSASDGGVNAQCPPWSSWLLSSADGSFTISIAAPTDASTVAQGVPVWLGPASGVQLTFDGAAATGTFTLARITSDVDDNGVPYANLAGTFTAQANGVQLVNGYFYSPVTK